MLLWKIEVVYLSSSRLLFQNHVVKKWKYKRKWNPSQIIIASHVLCPDSPRKNHKNMHPRKTFIHNLKNRNSDDTKLVKMWQES